MATTRTRTRTPSPPSTLTLRVRLSKTEKVKLIRLCVLHQSEHRHGNKKVFWTKIRGLLLEEIGKELRDPQQTVDGLVAQFQADIAREENGGGTILDDSELRQALSEWIAHLKEQKQGVHLSSRSVRASRTDVADSQQDSEQPRDSLLRTWSQREPSNDDDTASDASASPAAAEPERKRAKSARTRRSEGDDIINVMKSNSELMASAIEKLAGAVATAVAGSTAAAAAARPAAATTPVVDSEARIPATRVGDLEAKMTRLEERVEQTNSMLRELLDRLTTH